MQKDKIKKMIESSGNSFHYDVINFLREQDWNVLVSPYYCDNFSDKSKEVDIIAGKDIVLKDYVNSPKMLVKVRLFIECKYVKYPIVFWFDNKDLNRAESKIINETPLKSRDGNKLIEQHHYMINEEIAKLFSSDNNKEDVIFKALSQCLNSFIYYRESNFNLFPINRKPSPGLKNLEINYPLIICNKFENFFRVDKKDGSYSNITSNFQLEANYAYKDFKGFNINEYFLVDIIEFGQLKDFLKDIILDGDINAIKKIEAGPISNPG